MYNSPDDGDPQPVTALVSAVGVGSVNEVVVVTPGIDAVVTDVQVFALTDVALPTVIWIGAIGPLTPQSTTS